MKLSKTKQMREIGNLLIAAWHKVGQESKAIEKQNVLDDIGIDDEMNDSKALIEQQNNNTHDQIRNCVEQITYRYIDEMLRVESEKA